MSDDDILKLLTANYVCTIFKHIAMDPMVDPDIVEKSIYAHMKGRAKDSSKIIINKPAPLIVNEQPVINPIVMNYLDLLTKRAEFVEPDYLKDNSLYDRLVQVHKDNGFYPLIIEPLGKKPFRPVTGMLRMKKEEVMTFVGKRAGLFKKIFGLTYEKCNIGVLTGENTGITVIDFDVASKMCPESISGMKLYEYIQGVMKLLKLKTYTVSTPSGGIHMYFKYEPRLQTRICTKFADNIYSVDIRNNCAYVVASGQNLLNGTYSTIDDSPIIEMPSLIFELLKTSAYKHATDYAN